MVGIIIRKHTRLHYKNFQQNLPNQFTGFVCLLTILLIDLMQEYNPQEVEKPRIIWKADALLVAGKAAFVGTITLQFD